MEIINRMVFVDGENPFKGLIDLGEALINKMKIPNESIYSDRILLLVSANEIIKSEEDTANLLSNLNNKEDTFFIIYSCYGDIKWKPAFNIVERIIREQKLKINWLAQQVDIMSQFSIYESIPNDVEFFSQKVAFPQGLQCFNNCNIVICESISIAKLSFETNDETYKRKRH